MCFWSVIAGPKGVAIDPQGRCEGKARGKPTKSLRAPKGRDNLLISDEITSGLRPSQ